MRTAARSRITDIQYHRGNYPRTGESKLKGVTEDVARRIRLTVEVRCHRPTKVAHANLHRHDCAALVAACKVVRQPADVPWEAWMDGAGDEKGASVGYARILC